MSRRFRCRTWDLGYFFCQHFPGSYKGSPWGLRLRVGRFRLLEGLLASRSQICSASKVLMKLDRAYFV